MVVWGNGRCWGQKPNFSQPFDMVFMFVLLCEFLKLAISLFCKSTVLWLLTELSPIINDIFPTVGIQVSTPKRGALMRLLLWQLSFRRHTCHFEIPSLPSNTAATLWADFKTSLLVEFTTSTLYFYSPNNAAEVLTVHTVYFCFYFWNFNSNAWFDKLKEQQGVNSMVISKDALWTKSTDLKKEQAHTLQCFQCKYMGPVCLKFTSESFSADGKCLLYIMATGRNTGVHTTMQLCRWVQRFPFSEELAVVYGRAACNTSRYHIDVKTFTYVFQKDFQCESEKG